MCRRFDPIVTKLSTNVGLIKTQFEFDDELCEFVEPIKEAGPYSNNILINNES